MPGLTHPCPSQEGIAAVEILTVVPYLELRLDELTDVRT